MFTIKVILITYQFYSSINEDIYIMVSNKIRNIDLENEKNFENSKVLNNKIRSAQSKYYWSVDIFVKKHEELTFNTIKNKKVLEIGCSKGDDAEKYVKYCNQYVGIDISNEAIDVAKSKKIPKSLFRCTDGHKIPFEESSFDCVIVNSLLHHLNLRISIEEISRVLCKNGKLIFREPLGTNPLFQFYRLITPHSRTVDEKPFDLNDIKLLKMYFHMKHIQWFGFLNIFSAFTKNKAIRSVLSGIDQILSYTILKYFFWQISGILEKK